MLLQKFSDILVHLIRLIVLHPMTTVLNVLHCHVTHHTTVAISNSYIEKRIIIAPNNQGRHIDLATTVVSHPLFKMQDVCSVVINRGCGSSVLRKNKNISLNIFYGEVIFATHTRLLSSKSFAKNLVIVCGN